MRNLPPGLTLPALMRRTVAVQADLLVRLVQAGLKAGLYDHQAT
jgi:hypothetical protein